MLTLFNCQSAICGLCLSHTNNITTKNSFRLISSTWCQICLSTADIFTITELFLVCWSTGWEQWPRKEETIEMTWYWGIFLLLLLFCFIFYFILLFLVFTYLAKPIFPETSTKINTKNCQCYCKNKSTTLLSMLSPTIEVKSKFSQLLCSETTHLQLSFERLDIISV